MSWLTGIKILLGILIGVVILAVSKFFFDNEEPILFAQWMRTFDMYILGCLVWIGILKKETGQKAQAKILEARDNTLDDEDLRGDRVE